MIDKKLEPYYDRLLSIFVGIVSVLVIHILYYSPRTIVVKTKNKYNNKQCNGICF